MCDTSNSRASQREKGPERRSGRQKKDRNGVPVRSGPKRTLGKAPQFASVWTVNLQGLDLSRKSRSGIRREQYLQGKEFARNGISKERGWNLQRMDFAVNADYVVLHLRQ